MIKIEQATNYTEADLMILSKGLDANAQQQRGHKPVEYFAFFMRDDNNKIVGGCNGIMYYGCMYVDQLWIEEIYRGQDYGTQLMHVAEQLGRDNGCLFITTETMDWEGLEFYKKLGFRKETEQHGYFKDTVMYRMRKDFT